MLECPPLLTSSCLVQAVKVMVDPVKSKRTYNDNKLRKRLRANVTKAIDKYRMIEPGDLVMAALSGGKDSFVMLDILHHLKQTSDLDFDVVAVNLDQKQPGFPEHVLPDYFESLDIPYYIIDKDTYSVVKSKVPEGKTTCSLCSRLRRGTLYEFAEKIGATKIALGHHMDDIVETLFLNLFYGGKIKAMPPKLLTDDKRNIVIRPLTFCREKDIAKLAELNQYPIIPCNLCGSQENLQRQAVKQMLNEWDKRFPGRVETMFTAIQNVSPSQLADDKLFDFMSMAIDRTTDKQDYGFDDAQVSSSNLIEIVEL